MKVPFLFFFVVDCRSGELGSCQYDSLVSQIDGELPNEDDINELEKMLSDQHNGDHVSVMNFLRLDPLVKPKVEAPPRRPSIDSFYAITGQYIVDELCRPETLDKAIKLAEEYAQSHAQGRSTVYMRVATEHYPVEYVFGLIGNGLHDRHDFHEVCRIIPPF